MALGEGEASRLDFLDFFLDFFDFLDLREGEREREREGELEWDRLRLGEGERESDRRRVSGTTQQQQQQQTQFPPLVSSHIEQINSPVSFATLTNSPHPLITTAFTGLSFPSVGTFSIALTTSSKPRTTRPKTTCFPVRWDEGASVINIWEPLVCGPLFAMQRSLWAR